MTPDAPVRRLDPIRSWSRFLQRELLARPWLAERLDECLDQPLTALAMRDFLIEEAPDGDRLKGGLRRLRSWVLCHVAARDLLGLADLAEVCETMTVLAEVSVRYASEVLYRQLADRHGAPLDSRGDQMALIVVGMGKLGGRELNVSSDIDLVFVYPADGETAGNRPISHFDFFTRLGRILIGALGEVTADGFVFRVDMRLRPYGDSGPLAISFNALEHYFVTHGREWERFAWLKARTLYGGRDEELSEIVRPFVFRKYLDFGAIDALRELHGQIRRQAARREMAMNVKLGPGGIREIEFIAQVFQIIRGGREQELRQKSTTKVLELLGGREIISGDVVSTLLAAYRFLRNLEHRLQYLDDTQTHELPVSGEDRARLSDAMRCADVPALLDTLDRHRRVVTSCFQDIFSDPNETEHELDELWDENSDDTRMGAVFHRLRFRKPEEAVKRLRQLRKSSSYRNLPESTRPRFDGLVPRIIACCAVQAEPDDVLGRVLTIVESISRRGAYLSLLQQYPQALRRLVELVAASKWGADYLTRHPILLDELLDARNLEATPSWHEFSCQLREWLDAIEPDTERQMDLMREQYHAQVFRVLHQDIAGKWAVEQIGDHLSALADIVLDETIRQCWHKLIKRHRDEHRFAVVAYGKLGGKELGYGSDLDIVFLYRDDDPAAQEVYARLAQRMLTWMSSQTSAGMLFEIDTRLRPNGKSGLLVSHVDAFARYQEKDAWLWEHQALTRARYAAGDPLVGETFESIRRKMLCQQRDIDTLTEGILAMRSRLQASDPAKVGLFNVKNDPGGLIDFEFLIQFIVLGYACRHEQLIDNVGNIALALRAAELGLMDRVKAQAAADAYRNLRRMQHQQRLNAAGNMLPDTRGVAERQAVIALWEDLLGKRERA